jgi:hypothetical protein
MQFNIYKILLIIVILFSLSFVSIAQELYVGTNYHPHDSNPEQWKINNLRHVSFIKDATAYN